MREGERERGVPLIVDIKNKDETTLLVPKVYLVSVISPSNFKIEHY